MARSIKRGRLPNGNRDPEDNSVKSYYSQESGPERKIFRRKTRRECSELLQSLDVEELEDEPMPIVKGTQGHLTH